MGGFDGKKRWFPNVRTAETVLIEHQPRQASPIANRCRNLASEASMVQVGAL
jgi:hypothetical protein